MLLDSLENYVNEEETIQAIAAMIINGRNNEELSNMGYSEELIERAHLYALSLYY